MARKTGVLPSLLKWYRALLPLVFVLGGAAALAWQTLWQLDVTLALGVSAQGTALTIAAVMSGMTAGALWMGATLEKAPLARRRPWLTYGLLEAGSGFCALLPGFSTRWLEKLDAVLYQWNDVAGPGLQILFLGLVMGPSAFLMGATFPVLALLAPLRRSSVSTFYFLNVLGAGLGTVLLTFGLLPSLGRQGSSLVVAGIQLFILLLCLGERTSSATPQAEAECRQRLPLASREAAFFALASGFVIFSLEVCWFRMLRSAWLSTTDSFAIMLFSFLVALSLGAKLSKNLAKWKISFPMLFVLGGVAIMLATPLLERFDWWSHAGGGYLVRTAKRLAMSLAVMLSPVTLLGMSLPGLLDAAEHPRQWARLYALNTLGSVAGSAVAAWVLLERLGPVKTSWLAALAAGAAGCVYLTKRRRALALSVAALLAGLGVACLCSTGIDSSRVQGPASLLRKRHQILALRHGPDVTTAVVQTRQKNRVLFIDGYAASGEFGNYSAYMDAMGRLPMLLHPRPGNALVICFGTGQTARAVADENLERLDIVDVNAAVFAMADFFPSNREVLSDLRVRTVVMDGRAWLRRTREAYDVITLEPMPPFFAGTNSLYSAEFYEWIKSRLHPGGFAAQWFPMHLLSPPQAKAVAAAFQRAFPQTILWVDYRNVDGEGYAQQGILLGRKGDQPWDRWPGLERKPAVERPLDRLQLDQGVLLLADQLRAFTKETIPVTDDNQLLSFGKEGINRFDPSLHRFGTINMKEIHRFLGSNRPPPQ